jgi:hypothetical protein
MYRLGSDSASGSCLIGGADVYDCFASNARKENIAQLYDKTNTRAAPTMSWHIYNSCGKSGLWQTRCNNQLMYESTVNTVAFAANQGLWATHNVAVFWEGLWGEQLIYNRILLQQERDWIYSYLYHEWQISLGYPKVGYLYGVATELVDDGTGARMVSNDIEVVQKRAVGNSYIWGTNGRDLSTLPVVTPNVASPVTGLSNLLRCDQMDLAIPAHKLGGGAITVNIRGYRFVPAVNARGKAILWCPGHTGVVDDSHAAYPTNTGYGMWRSIESMLVAGYDVYVYLMPGFTIGNPNGANEANWGAVSAAPHTWLGGTQCGQAAVNCPYSETEGSFLRLFLAMPLAMTSYAFGHGATHVYSAGMSGGGWSATYVGAFDTRISKSYCIAGMEPLWFHATGSFGDAEQCNPLNSQIGVRELAILSAHNRVSKMVVNQNDNVAFGEAQFVADGAAKMARARLLTFTEAWADFKNEISNVLAKYGIGSFDYRIDTAATEHQVTWQTISWMLADLEA